MNIAAEKAEIMKMFDQVHDEALIKAIKNLLDFGLHRQFADDAMEASIDKGLEQARQGMLRNHEDVMRDMRNRYKA
ncbi:MAG: hypothetical protein JSS82_05240 [Bacteroidetes bacterium]|nr:hypothetical protein [Bacteroidota bacterium]